MIVHRPRSISREPFSRGGLIACARNPDLPFFIISRINPNLIIAADPVPIFVMGRDPNVFPPFRNPNPVYLPMPGRQGYYRWRIWNGSSIMAMVRGDDRRRITILEQIVKGHRSKPDGNSFPAPPNSIIGKGIRIQN